MKSFWVMNSGMLPKQVKNQNNCKTKESKNAEFQSSLD